MQWNQKLQNKLDDLVQMERAGNIEGVHLDLPIEVYHHAKCPGLSKTDLDKSSKSYEHLLAYKAERLEALESRQETPSKALIFGSAFHDMLFTPNRFRSNYGVEPEVPADINRRTKEGKGAYAIWEKEVLEPFLRNKDPLSEDDFKTLVKMKAKADLQPYFQGIVSGTEFVETTIFFKDKKTGILLKTRPDVFNKELGICLDAKTTEDASAVSFRRSIVNYNYDKQAALQIDGIRSVYGKDFEFIFSAHEKSSPFGIALYRLDEACLDVGRALYQRDLEYIANIQSNPESKKGYPEEIVNIGLPAYAFDLSSR